MSDTWQLDVATFMKLAGQDIPDKPGVPWMDTLILRHKLMREELHEFAVAVDAYYAMTHDDLLAELTDAIADLLYVTLGTAVALGVDIAPVFDEVHRSNMTKFIDGHKREDGKWIKGPSYTPADVAGVLAKQLKASP